MDHFSQQAHSPYEQAQTLDDLSTGLQLVRILLILGHHQQACDAYRGDLAIALLFKVEAHVEVLALLRPLFLEGWATVTGEVTEDDAGYVLNAAAIALRASGEFGHALAANEATLRMSLLQKAWADVGIVLTNTAHTYASLNCLASEARCRLLALEITEISGEKHLFSARLERFWQLTRIGKYLEAEALWRVLDAMGFENAIHFYRPGEAEWYHGEFLFRQGLLQEQHLSKAEGLAQAGNARAVIRYLHRLRGKWRLRQARETADYAAAARSLGEAVRMAHEVRLSDPEAETLLALARLHQGVLEDSRALAGQLASANRYHPLALSELWLAIAKREVDAVTAASDRERARDFALKAYRQAWANGEPYVQRHELERATDLLRELGAEVPVLPPYDATKAEKFAWEDEVMAAIAELRREKEIRDAEAGGESGW
ncbi:MAG: hypothetical protein JWO94_3285 [Verrucomicrobiaceae bacterium]|nr:hypothetical protein [Verrucomicrobiaceae bacterium]